jgi:HNH endonuclease
VSVGRKTRSIPPALRRALQARDRGCRFPGCTHTRYLDAHHVRHWAHGGETKPSNLISLCSFHHRQVHEGRVRVEVLDEGAFRFVRPDGRAFDSTASERTRPFNWTHLPQMHRERHIHIDEHTAVTRWRGERMDYSIATEILLTRAHRPRDVPAGTRTITPNG